MLLNPELPRLQWNGLGALYSIVLMLIFSEDIQCHYLWFDYKSQVCLRLNCARPRAGDYITTLFLFDTNVRVATVDGGREEGRDF